MLEETYGIPIDEGLTFTQGGVAVWTEYNRKYPFGRSVVAFELATRLLGT
jgi:hypothetical protein